VVVQYGVKFTACFVLDATLWEDGEGENRAVETGFVPCMFLNFAVWHQTHTG